VKFTATIRAVLAIASATLLTSCVSTMPSNISSPTSDVLRALAPGGTLRAAINFGNPILANKDAKTGEPFGVSIDIARELGKRLNVPVELVTFTSAGKVVDAVSGNEVSIAFVAIDPVRAATTAYTAPYVIIEGAYLVRNDSPLRDNSEVDRAGARVVVGAGSAYDLYLTREMKHATLVRAPTSPLVTDEMLRQNLEVAAGVRQQLEADALRVGGVRLLPGRFMVINQALAMPLARSAASDFLKAFVEDLKASGFVATALERHGIKGAVVAPPAPRTP
jgi:polar amino acid transport system substrate-binding protein